ncbi:O-antigen polymerase [Vibrio fortis]|uniref:O-antigen polymerase n=1 Tax=Vibrio fortis TaxID=212667 RepID=UPI0036F40117
MNKLEFWNIYYNNAEVYTIITLLVLTTSLIIAKTLRFSVYHPVVFYFFFNFQFALIGVIFLDYLGLIENSLSLYFYSVELVFFLGLLFSIFFIYLGKIIGVRSNLNNEINALNVKNSKLGYEICTLVYILSLIITYISFGIPLFSESKWSVFASIPLAGVIGRLGVSAHILILVYLSIKFVKNENFNRLDKLNIVVLLISGLLSGKKMFFLDYFFIFFITTYYLGYTISKEYIKKIVFYFSIISLLVMGSVYLNQLVMNGIESNPFELVIKRFAMSGDAQILSLPNGIINNLYYGESFIDIIFYEIKGLFSVLGIHLDGPSLGVKMMKIHYPYLESNTGPASTFDIFYYVYFRDFSYILALFTGLFIGFFAKFKPRVNGEFSLIFWVVLSFNSYTLIYNPQIFISNLIFNLVFLLLFWMSIKIRI